MQLKGTFYVAAISLQTGRKNDLWNLNDPGAQTYPVKVYFPHSFPGIPTVSASIIGVETDPTQHGSLRVQVTVKPPDRESFQADISKQGNVRLHRVDVEWAAHD